MKADIELEIEVRVSPSLLERLRDHLRVRDAQGRGEEPESALLRTKVQILENGGLAPLHRLVDRSGKDTGAQLLRTRFGLSWKMRDGSWVSDRPAALRKHGLKPRLMNTTAWAALRDGRVEIYPVAANYLERVWE